MRNMFLAVLIMVLGPGIVFHVCYGGQVETDKMNLVVTETSLGECVSGRGPSPDSRHIVYVQERDHKQVLVLDGVEGKEFNEIGGVQFSPDSMHIVYRAGLGTKKGYSTKWLVVLDGKEGKEYDEVSEICFSPSGTRLAYVAHYKRQQSWPASSRGPAGTRTLTTYHVVLDGVEGKAYDKIGKLTFSRDGSHLAYSAERAGKCFVVLDGAELPACGRVGNIQFSPNGKRIAYEARGLRDPKWHVVVDGKIGAPYDKIREGTLSVTDKHFFYAIEYTDAQGVPKQHVVFDGVEGREYEVYHPGIMPCLSPGGRLAYIGWRGKKAVVVADGVEGKEYDYVDAFSLCFSPDGTRLAYCAKEGEEYCVVVNGVEGKHYDKIEGRPLLSPSGEHVVYAAKRDAKWVVVFDGSESQEYESLGYPWVFFSPDGNRFAFFATRGPKDRLVVVDGVADPKSQCEYAHNLVFDPTGKHLAYVAVREPKMLVVEDGLEGPSYDKIGEGSLYFSPDGKHLAYTAYTASPPLGSSPRPGKWHVVVDGLETGNYDSLVSIRVTGREAVQYSNGKKPSWPVFDAADHMYVLAVRNNEYVRVDIQIIEKK